MNHTKKHLDNVIKCEMNKQKIFNSRTYKPRMQKKRGEYYKTKLKRIWRYTKKPNHLDNIHYIDVIIKNKKFMVYFD